MTQSQIVKAHLILIFDLGRLCLTCVLQVSFGRGIEMFKPSPKRTLLGIANDSEWILKLEEHYSWFLIKNNKIISRAFYQVIILITTPLGEGNK